MTKKEFVLDTFRRYGKTTALCVQDNASEMTGDELYNESRFIPSFIMACINKNMLKRSAGFVCISPSGRIVELIQPYDSDIYTSTPEDLRSHWRFKWSKNPKHALPFICITESYYTFGDCCIGEDGIVYRSKLDVNTWNPLEFPQYWEAMTE